MGNGPVRVMIFCDHIGYPGNVIHGPARWLSYTVPLFDPNKVRVDMAVLGQDHAFRKELENAGIRVIMLNRSRNDIRSFTDIMKIMFRYKTDVVYLMGMKSCIVGRIAARVLGCKAIINLRDTNPLTRGERLIMRLLAGTTDLAIGCSEEVAEFAVTEFSIARSKSVALPNGLPVAKYRQHGQNARTCARRRLELEGRDYAVGVIGRLAPSKGHVQLLRSFAKVVTRVECAKLCVIGDGALREDLVELARELNLQRHVIFLGHLDNVAELLPGLDIVTFGSLWGEGRSIACMEAIASCRPVVAFDVTGINNVVINGETGILVHKGDLDALAEAIVRLHTDRALYEAMVHKCDEMRHAFDVAEHPRKLEQACLAVREGWEMQRIRGIFEEGLVDTRQAYSAPRPSVRPPSAEQIRHT